MFHLKLKQERPSYTLDRGDHVVSHSRDASSYCLRMSIEILVSYAAREKDGYLDIFAFLGRLSLAKRYCHEDVRVMEPRFVLLGDLDMAYARRFGGTVTAHLDGRGLSNGRLRSGLSLASAAVAGPFFAHDIVVTHLLGALRENNPILSLSSCSHDVVISPKKHNGKFKLVRVGLSSIGLWLAFGGGGHTGNECAS